MNRPCVMPVERASRCQSLVRTICFVTAHREHELPPHSPQLIWLVKGNVAA